MEEKDKEIQENENKEADADDNEALVAEALKSFCCYLYVGKGRPYYKAQPWNDDESYPIERRLQCLDVLASNKKTELVPLDKIKLAMDKSLIRRPETLMFALAMCARQKKSERLRAGAYHFLTEHCKKWKYFILFIKYASILSKMTGASGESSTGKHNGCGRGWRNAVNKWYLTKSPVELVELVTHHKGDHGWKHKDILKLSHPDTRGLDVQMRAIICYIMRGLKETQKEYGSDPEVKTMLACLESVENFKKCEDPVAVAEALKSRNFNIDQIHPKALKSEQVWLEALVGMDYRTVLKNVPRLNDLGFLTKEGRATEIVVPKLMNGNSLEWNVILPKDILSILNQYEGLTLSFPYHRLPKSKLNVSAAELWKCEARAESFPRKGKQKNVPVGSHKKAGEKKSWTNAKPRAVKQTAKHKVPVVEPDVRILEALRSALYRSQRVNIPMSSELTYLVSVRLPGYRYKFGDTCAETGLAIALPLMNRNNLPEDGVTIIGYEPRSLSGLPVKITKDKNFDEALGLLFTAKKKLHAFVPMPTGALGWAYEEKKKYDVFINVTTELPNKDLVASMNAYKRFVDSPNVRFINVILSKTPFELEGDEWNDCLTINGFDTHVPWIIDAYVHGLF